MVDVESLKSVTAKMMADKRIVELKFLLKVLRGWHMYNETVNVGMEVSIPTK